MLRRTRPALSVLCILPVLVLLGGCSTYSCRLANLRPDLAAGNYDEALTLLEETRKDKDELLYHLERGLVLHYADRWQESNDEFQVGEELAEDLYTRSISQAVFSLMTSDNTISYRAAPFEMAMIPYYRALNYAYLGEKTEALVEARKASVYLQQYTDQVLQPDEEGATAAEDAAIAVDLEQLRNNAFLQYFSGLLYEWDGELNDAFIAYREALRAYGAASSQLAVETPPWLGEDLLRTGRKLGFREELEQLAQSYPDLFPAAEEGGGSRSSVEEGGSGEVVLLLELGFVAHKEQRELNVPILKDDDRSIAVDDWAESLVLRTRPGWSAGKKEIEYWLRLAVPELVSDRPWLKGARVTAGVVGGNALAVPVEDLEGRARLSFEAAYGKILLKTLARALTKYLAKQKADNVSWATGALANLFGAATETADTRSWLTLPNLITMARLRLPPGTYDLQVELVDAHGAPAGNRTIHGVTVRAGGWTFLSQRILDAPPGGSQP
jgi:hypothetical protein